MIGVCYRRFPHGGAVTLIQRVGSAANLNIHLQLGFSEGQTLRLPLETTLDLHYGDGDLKLDVGCVISANIDGNARFPGVALVGLSLCEQPLNNWNAAVDKAADVMRRFEQQNPKAKDLRALYLSATEPELQAIGGKIWRKSDQDLFALRTPELAKSKFAREAAGGHEEIVSGRWKDTLGIVSQQTACIGRRLGSHRLSLTSHGGSAILSA